MAQAPSTPRNYASDTPTNKAQQKMRLAHMASYIHEDAGHSLDHVKSAAANLQKGNFKAAAYDLTHALPHAQGAHDKSAKLVEQTHDVKSYATARPSVRSLRLGAMNTRAK